MSNKKVDPDREPVAYGYGRVSHARSAEKGTSLETQTAEHKRYYDYRLGEEALWGETFADDETDNGKKGCSGRIPLHERPAGSALCQRLLPGDHVILTELSRGFRSFKDAIHRLEIWIADGINIHLIRQHLDTSHEGGKLMLRMLAAVAEFERAMTAERTREALKHRKRTGKITSGMMRYGFRLDGHVGSRRVVPDVAEREVMRRIVELYDEENLSFDEIYYLFLKLNIRTRKDKAWSRIRIWRAYKRAKSLPELFNSTTTTDDSASESSPSPSTTEDNS